MKEIIEEAKPAYGETFTMRLKKTDHSNAYSAPHVHDFVEILYCFRGEYCVLVNDVPFDLCPGDMIVINSRQVHESYPKHSVYGEYLILKFYPEMIYATYNSISESQYALLFLVGQGGQAFQPTALTHTFEDIVQELANQSYGYEMALKSDLYRIILWIIRNSNWNIEMLDSYTETTLMRIISALSYIEKHYMENITVQEIAQNVFLEYTHFSRIFKKITQKNCSEYINQLRVQRAEVLLSSTNRSITEIAEAVGYNNVSYFIKQFRLVKGLSPKQYQKRYFSKKEL